MEWNEKGINLGILICSALTFTWKYFRFYRLLPLNRTDIIFRTT